jgi:sugar lactone lactonase YvrE
MLAWSGSALAQLPLSTFAGRQIGDGRPAIQATLNRPSGLAFAADGALLIVDRVHARIRRVDPTTGIISTLAGSIQGDGGNGKVADQGELNVPITVRVDGPTGDLLIAETEGHVIRRVLAATGVLTTIAGTADTPSYFGDGGLATAALLSGPTDAIPDGAGNILIADRANHRIRRIDTGGNINTVAGNGTPGYTGDSVLPGSAPLAQLNFPHCILPIPGGGFYICDEFNHAIRRVGPLGAIATVAGNGLPGFADGPATGVATLNKPRALAFADGTNNVLLISDAGNNRIRRLDLLGGTLTTIAGTGADTFSPDGSPAATSPIRTPSGLVVAPDGRIVFSENFAHRVRAIDADGNLVTLVGGIAEFDGDGGPAVDAQFGQVKAVARDKDGHFVISDAGNNRVRRMNAFTGVVETIAGSGEPEFGGDGGSALDAGLTLSDAVVDSSGRLIISDSDNNRIRRVDAAGNISTIVNETGVAGYTGDNGVATAAQIHHPTGIEIDGGDNLYIADFLNHAIRKVDAAGNIVTVAGTGVPGYNGDDITATTAQLNSPTDLAVDGAGNIYIADFENNRIRFVSAATGLISTVAGTGVAGFSGDGGLAAAARFKNPSDVDVDANGNVWVADMENHRVRRFTVGGNIETVVGNGLRGYAGDGGDPVQARLLFPIRLLVLAPDQVLIAERDNFVLRALGEIASDCSGTGAATCVPGGGKTAADCFFELKLQAPPAGGPSPKISCVDGDPSCDHDAVGGQCTFRLASCLNNTDTRIPGCAPAAITSVKLAGNQGLGAGGLALANGLGALAPSVALPRGRGVSFTNAFTEQNGCTQFGDFVVTRGKKNGKGKLNAVTTTSASGKDKDKIKLLCLAP